MNRICSLVSVIVPIYEVEKYLQACIDSICKQTYTQLEIILVDDGSPDNCGSICDKNSMQDPRIIVIHKENEGLSSARNAGIDIATGEYIAFVDADDTLHSRFIEILVGLCEVYECDIAQCDYLTVSEESLKLPLNPLQFLNIYNNRQAMHELCDRKNGFKYSITWNKVYKKYLFDDIRYPVGKIHEDEFTTYLVIWNARKIAVVNLYLYYYLQRPTSIMGKKFTLKRLDVLDAYRDRLHFLKKNQLEIEYLYTLQNYFCLLENNYILVKKYINEHKELCTQLLEEKERVASQLPRPLNKEHENTSNYMKKIENCLSYDAGSRILLYGAGKWGQIYYQWITKNHYGKIVGWIDNLWYTINSTPDSVLPLDSLLSITYDYILISIKNKEIQIEVTKNLISWGVAPEKILSIYVDE